MKKIIKVALIGGTGKSGQYLVKRLLANGISIKLLVRNIFHAPDSHPLIEIVFGNVHDSAAIHQLVTGCEAIISTLGLGIPPSEPTIFSQSTRYVLQAMRRYGVKRYILITGLNVDSVSDQKSMQTQQATLWMKTHYPLSTADKQLEYELLIKSSVDWTLVRLPKIELTNDHGRAIKVSLADCPGNAITAIDLADFLIGQLEDRSYIRQAPFIANIQHL
jgi:putative NADH-flavin reductase